MIIQINDLNLNYEATGSGRPVILLHGWGGGISSFAPVQEHLRPNFTVYSLDLPGFGQSDPPPVSWDTQDYADCVAGFMEKLSIERPILIGHSFGGRLSIRLGAKGLASKIVLVDSAGLKPRRPLSYYIKVYSYKIAKKVLALPGLRRWQSGVLDWFRGKSGSEDYRQTSGVMRETFVRVVNEDLKELLPQINAPTLLVWGSLDTATPLRDGKMMEKLIPDAGLAVLEGAGHFSYLERLPRFLRIIDSFLAPERGAKND